MPNVNGINASVTSEILITIDDINDEKPEFYSCDTPDTCVKKSSFSGNIDEHSAVGLPVLGLNMTVMDKDKVSILVCFQFCGCSYIH